MRNPHSSVKAVIKNIAIDQELMGATEKALGQKLCPLTNLWTRRTSFLNYVIPIRSQMQPGVFFEQIAEIITKGTRLVLVSDLTTSIAITYNSNKSDHSSYVVNYSSRTKPPTYKSAIMSSW